MDPPQLHETQQEQQQEQEQQQYGQQQSQLESDESGHLGAGSSSGGGGADDPALAAQMRQEAEAAADAGAAQALAEAQAASAAAREAERDAAGEEQEQERQTYDLGQEFAQYAPHHDQQQQQGQQQGQQHDSGRTFLTGVDNASHANLQQAAGHNEQQTEQQQATDASAGRMSDEELIGHVERQMMEYERTAQYLEAEKARQHLEALKKRLVSRRRDDLEKIQGEDVRVFFAMVAQHQENFDRTWQKKTLEHKLRADDLIDACKWKHEDQQRELYESLRRKRLPKFSVELLNMRKRQVMLARAKSYVAAEKVKRKADVLEQLEVERIRESAREENQLRFQALLKKQEWDRRQLGLKLQLEKKSLLEAKAQDFLRLRKRLRNAEMELKKTHVRQQLLAEKKTVPLYSYNAQEAAGGAGGAAPASAGSTSTSQRYGPGGASTARDLTGRGSVLRNTGMQRVMMGASSSSSSGAPPARQRSVPLKSARELARAGSGSASASNSARASSSYETQQSMRTGQSIVGGGDRDRPRSKPQQLQREEKDAGGY